MRPVHPPRGGAWAGPQLPKRLMRDFFRIEVKKVFCQDEGGIYKTVEQSVSEFQGALLPINNKDLQYLPEGISTVNSQKLYTNGDELTPSGRVQDSLDRQTYTVVTELTHGPIHGLRRYIVTKGGTAGNG